MRKSRQFWQDVDLAIYTLMLRQFLHQIIVEGRNFKQPSSEIKIRYPNNTGPGSYLISPL